MINKLFKKTTYHNKVTLYTFILLLLFNFIIKFNNPLFALNLSKEKIDWLKIKKESQYIIEDDKNDILANFRYSISLANLGKIEEAFEHFEIIKDKTTISDFNNIISPYILMLTKKPNDILLLNYAAFSSVINSEYRNSIPYFEKLIKIEQDNIWIRNYLAATYLELEEYNKAKSEIKKNLEIKDNKYSHLILGIIYYETGKYIKAIIELGRSGDLVKKIINN